MDSGNVYISRKKKLLAELKALGLLNEDLLTLKGWQRVAITLCNILSRFDLGEKADDAVTSFLAFLESNPSAPLDIKKEKFYSTMCLLYTVTDEFRDYSSC